MGRDDERGDGGWDVGGGGDGARSLADGSRLATLISKTRHSVTATPQTRWASLDGGRGRLRRAAATRASEAPGTPKDGCVARKQKTNPIETKRRR